MTKREYIEKTALRTAQKALAQQRIDGSKESLLDLRVQTMRPGTRFSILVAGLVLAGLSLTTFLRDGSALLGGCFGLMAAVAFFTAVRGRPQTVGCVLKAFGDAVGDSILNGIISALF